MLMTISGFDSYMININLQDQKYKHDITPADGVSEHGTTSGCQVLMVVDVPLHPAASLRPSKPGYIQGGLVV